MKRKKNRFEKRRNQKHMKEKAIMEWMMDEKLFEESELSRFGDEERRLMR